jgi:O-antigen/teichoic acid export membrane protein
MTSGTWTAVQQLIQTGSGAVIALLLVRALSVSDYGHYSYALGLASVAMNVMSAGLAGLAVKALVADRPRNAAIVSALIITREAFGLLGYALVIAVALTSGSFDAVVATLLAALCVFGRALDAPEMWYTSKYLARRTAVLRVTVTACFFALRLGALVLWPSVWLFVLLFVAESAVVSVSILIRYLRDRDAPGLVTPSLRDARDLVRRSWPLMLSGFANQVNMRADIVILQALSGSVSVGLYAAAARLSELTYFLPVVFMNATLPHMLEVREKHGADSEEYRAMLQRSYDGAFWSGIGIAAVVALAGPPFIQFFFGQRYSESIPVLLIHLIACPFIFMGAVYSKWIIAENFLWSSLWRHLAGAGVNLCVNFTLVPSIGINGAATASVFSYATASYFTAFAGRNSRSQAIHMSKAVTAPIRLIISVAARRR